MVRFREYDEENTNWFAIVVQVLVTLFVASFWVLGEIASALNDADKPLDDSNYR